MSTVPVHEQPIESLMSRLPISVKPDTTVGSAVEQMNEHGVHHLPVLSHGEVIGVLRARDLAIVETAGGKDAAERPVSEVLIDPPRIVDAAEPIGRVLERLIEAHGDYVIVRRDDLVVGIVTQTDLLESLSRATGALDQGPAPETIRKRILAEHHRIRGLLDHMEHLADRLEEGERTEAVRLRQWTKELGAIMRGHLRLEERVLLPAIREADGFGDARAAELLREHEEQRALLDRVIGELHRESNPTKLVVGVKELIRALREDIVEEEKEFLSEGLLRDSVMPTDFFGG